ELYGDGVNPYTQGMEDIGEVLEQAGFGEYAEQIMATLQGNDDAKDSPKVTVDMEKFKASQKQNITLPGHDVKGNSKAKPGKEEL
ncbi:MAG: hypothetical protein SGARI_007997, partial [Bacillariaceae sp.]